ASDPSTDESLALTIPSIEIDHRALATYIESPSFEEVNAVWLEDPSVWEEATMAARTDASKDSNDSSDSIFDRTTTVDDESTSSDFNHIITTEGVIGTTRIDSSGAAIETSSDGKTTSLIASSFDALDPPTTMVLPLGPPSPLAPSSLPTTPTPTPTTLSLHKMSFQALLLQSDTVTTLESHDIVTMLAPVHVPHDSEHNDECQVNDLQLDLSDPRNRCSYRKGKCGLPRTRKRNGALHTYCAFHRWRSVENQKAFDAKRRKTNLRSR
ncbi:hypothetical protein PybrP1_010187, partial [[Pythium] brassicae (nom. inval.)]